MRQEKVYCLLIISKGEKMNYYDALRNCFFKGITGSRAYGTNLPTSDTDYRGVFILPTSERIGLFDLPHETVNPEEEDDKLYELKKFFDLAIKATPNIIELLWLPPDCIVKTSTEWENILTNRNMFITKKAVFTHSCYAISQLKKARGQNKLINNPMSVDRPSRLDFCWVAVKEGSKTVTIPISETGIDLTTCRATAVPHLTNCYNLYPNGSGVFKGDMLVFESVPKQDSDTCIGMLTYQEDGFKTALTKWKEYWDWMKNRNPDRWKNQEKGLDFDEKNILHLIRILMSAKNIVDNGEPIVRFQGKDLEFLRKIREGAFTYEELMDVANPISDYVEGKMNGAIGLPDSCNMKAVNRLFMDTITSWERNK